MPENSQYVRVGIADVQSIAEIPDARPFDIFTTRNGEISRAPGNLWGSCGIEGYNPGIDEHKSASRDQKSLAAIDAFGKNYGVIAYDGGRLRTDNVYVLKLSRADEHAFSRNLINALKKLKTVDPIAAMQCAQLIMGQTVNDHFVVSEVKVVKDFKHLTMKRGLIGYKSDKSASEKGDEAVPDKNQSNDELALAQESLLRPLQSNTAVKDDASYTTYEGNGIPVLVKSFSPNLKLFSFIESEFGISKVAYLSTVNEKQKNTARRDRNTSRTIKTFFGVAGAYALYWVANRNGGGKDGPQEIDSVVFAKFRL